MLGICNQEYFVHTANVKLKKQQLWKYMAESSEFKITRNEEIMNILLHELQVQLICLHKVFKT